MVERHADCRELGTSGFRAKLDLWSIVHGTATVFVLLEKHRVAWVGCSCRPSKRIQRPKTDENGSVSMAKPRPRSFWDFSGRRIPGISTPKSTYSSSNGTEITLFRNISSKSTKIYHRYSSYSFSWNTLPVLPVPKKMLHSIYCSSHLWPDDMDPYLYQSLSKHLMLCELWVSLILQPKNTGWCENKLKKYGEPPHLHYFPDPLIWEMPWVFMHAWRQSFNPSHAKGGGGGGGCTNPLMCFVDNFC